MYVYKEVCSAPQNIVQRHARGVSGAAKGTGKLQGASKREDSWSGFENCSALTK